MSGVDPQPLLPGPASAPGREGLRPAQAVGWVLLAGLAAHLGGALVNGFLRVWVAGSARAAQDPALTTDPRVVVPAMVVSALMLVAVVALAVRVAGLRAVSALGLFSAPPATLAAAALGTVMLGPTADALMRFMDALLPTWTFGVLALLDDLVRKAPLWWVLPVFALLPGISEELLFRGLLQRAFRPGAVAIASSGVGFAVFHLDPHHVVGVLPLGLFLAWVGSRVGTLVTVFAHVSNNAVAVLSVRVEPLSVGYGTDQPMPWYWVPASLGVVGLCAGVIARAAPGPGRLSGDSARPRTVR